MTTQSFRVTKLDEIEALLPGFRAVWPRIKAACGTRARCPKGVTFTDESRPVYLNDDECGKRFALDLRDMSLAERSLHVSGGEWACHAGPHHDGAVAGIPDTHALLTCAWNDHHRYFSIEIQVAKLPAQIARVAS